MRTLGRAFLLVLVIAFLAGAWQARHPPAPRGGGDRAASPFRTAPVERARATRPPPELVSVRTARRQGYDRVLFTFRGGMPGYRVRYATSVRDEAGRPLALQGGTSLAVAFEPALARDPGGASTFQPATITTGYPRLRQVRFAGDFEGRVSFGLGVAGRGGFRVTELAAPSRVAVDVRG
jgi:hypothetical protein